MLGGRAKRQCRLSQRQAPVSLGSATRAFIMGTQLCENKACQRHANLNPDFTTIVVYCSLSLIIYLAVVHTRVDWILLSYRINNCCGYYNQLLNRA